MFTRIAVSAGLFALVAAGGFWPGSGAAARAPELGRLAAVFDLARGAARDTNGDGLADSVVARVIVPASPASEDVEAATNIAARLGYETTALTLPLVVADDQVAHAAEIQLPILVGRENAFIKKLVDKGAVDLAPLEPGQGLLAVVESPLGGAGGIVVVGGDAAGTLAAAVELAARLPRLWSMTGITLGGIEQQAVQYLKGRGVAATGASVTSILVDSDRRGIASVAVRVDVGPRDLARAVKILEDLDAAHRSGRDARVLNFAEAAATIVTVRAGGAEAGRASVRRSGLNARTLTPPVDPEEFMPDTTITGRAAAAAAAGTGGGRGGAGAAGGGTAAAEAPAGAAESRPAATAAAAAPPQGQNGGPGGAAPPVPVVAKPFDLSNAYSIDGWFGDGYVDLIPDRTETTLVLGDPQESLGAAHIAARLGLESTGISLPLTRPCDKVRDPSREPSPILIGRTNTKVQQLVKIGKARLDDLQPGEGAIQIVPRAFGVATATVVAGADPAGTEAASLYLARRVPHVWDTARGALSYDDLVTEATRFLGARNGAGQAVQAVSETRAILAELKDKKIESVDARLFLEKGDAAFAAHLAGYIKQTLKDAKVTVASQGATDPVPVFEDKADIPWEVDEFWAKFRSEVLPKVKAGSTVDMEVRLSEPPEVRQSVAEQARNELAKAGAARPRVRVLSAYKQGYSWLTEQVIPELRGKGGRSVHVKALAHKPDLAKKYKFYMVPSRWLQELFPVDEIFERDLGIPKSAFTMELVDEARQTYEIDVKDGAGKVVYHGAFSPKVVEREYLDKFPGWAKVEVTTGWLAATVDGQVACDARIATDPERFWDYYQGKVLPRVYDHVMRVTGSRPTVDKQPFFRDLDVEVWMSEPDFRIGVDEEQISSLEALHEDIYFVTLDFFAAMGRTITRQRIGAPGKILPIIHPDRAGKPGQFRILYAANAATGPRMEFSYKERGIEKPVLVTRPFTRIDTTAPQAVRAVVRADRVSEIEVHVDAANDREAGRAADALDDLERLHAAGLYRDALSFDHVDRVAVAIGLREARTRRVIRTTGVALASNVWPAGGGRPKSPLVTWDHVIGPDEAEDIVKKLAAFPEVKAYRVGKSYRGRDLSVMEITVPTSSDLVSVAKLSAYKPTIYMMGRQHANEVSSTSHMLRLAELLATDPAYREILKKVNVIMDPVMNPDGAQIAYDLQKLTPTYMLHAGRYSALGMDVSSRQNNLLPEAEVDGRIWREWLPDIYLNPHGYPSHEWVQQFSGYVSPQFRAYWTSRGWYTMISGLRDPRYPDHAEAIAAIREAVVRDVSGNSDVRAMDLRAQARYLKWAAGFGTHVYNIEIYKDTTIFFSDPESGEPRGSRRAAAPAQAASGRRGTMSAYPQVTFDSGMTEAPDETAQGPWLNLVTKAGFSFLMAHVAYLRDGRFTIERIEENGQRDGAVLTMLRVRPVMPGRAAAPAAAGKRGATGGDR